MMRTCGPLREGTMPVALPKPRFLCIALAAIVVPSLLPGSASAGCTSMPDRGACQSACLARRPPQGVTPVRATVEPSALHRNIPFPNENTCPNRCGCVCCPQCPAAPQPKGHRIGENRPEPNRKVAAIGAADPASVARPSVGLVPVLRSPPQKSPLYLRNARLLI
jgi:hypothetical protein